MNEEPSGYYLNADDYCKIESLAMELANLMGKIFDQRLDQSNHDDYSPRAISPIQPPSHIQQF